MVDAPTMGSGNGRASVTKEDLVKALGDRSRFQFKEDELDVSEDVTGVSLHLKTLSVAERESLPDLVDENGKQQITIPKLAQVFAAVVTSVKLDGKEGPALTAEEAEAFLGEWPATALDKVIEKFGELTGTGEEQKAAAGTFPKSE